MPPFNYNGKRYAVLKNEKEQCKGCVFTCLTMNGTGCKCPDDFPTSECKEGEVYIEA